MERAGDGGGFGRAVVVVGVGGRWGGGGRGDVVLVCVVI